MILAVTGHRLEKLGWKNLPRLQVFARDQLTELKPKVVLTGMAQGWDQAVAEACLDLKIPFHAFVPFEGQETVWPTDAQARYRFLLTQACDISIGDMSDGVVAAMHRRNKALVDHCEQLLALWNGSAGGTAHCVAYARQVKRPIVSVWYHWLRLLKEAK